VLKPQDILVTLKLVALAGRGEGWTYASLAGSLSMSASEVHACVARAMRSSLLGLDPWARYSDRRPSPKMNEIVSLVTVGLKYLLPAEKGGPARGMPTSFGAEPLKSLLVTVEAACPVWAANTGGIAGFALKPIYRTCVEAAAQDVHLYELLALADALRDPDGKPRERQLAVQEFERRCQSSSRRGMEVAP
jgi:hypothetical protein